MALQFKNCCFFIELRTGSLIIGYLSLVSTLILTVLTVIGLASTDKSGPKQQGQTTTAANGIPIIHVIELILLIINLIFVIALLIGLHKEKRRYVKAFLIYNAIYIFVSVILFVITISTGAVVRDIVQNLISLALGIYFLLIIRSYYLKME